MIRMYFESNPCFAPSRSVKNTQFTVVDNDTFTTASEYNNPCCLNFASHKRPGGAYLAVIDVPMPIKTQEEDLFRRSNLPGLMDTPTIRAYYPLKELQAIYCSMVMVNKDKVLNPILPFEVAVITMPAVVNPQRSDLTMVSNRVRRILEIAADQKHDNLILGAWGCGVFNNDPRLIALLFKDFLTREFSHIFENVVFAIPGKDSENFKIFQEVYQG